MHGRQSPDEPAAERCPPSIDRSSDGIEGRRRDDAELLQALIGALALLTANSRVETALRETFDHAMVGLGAQVGLLAEVSRTDPPEVELLCSSGLTEAALAACEQLRSS